MTTMINNDEMPTALFRRQYLGYQGGHGKVWDYFNHVRRSMLYQPKIYFTKDSIFDDGNPWKHETSMITKRWEPAKADLLFLAGMDWQDIPDDFTENIPVISLVQGIRHADPGSPLYEFLGKRAFRICVSQEVADAILSTGKVNGPVSVISNGIDLQDLMNSQIAPQIERKKIFIAALKDTPTGEYLSTQLQKKGYDVDLLTHQIVRSEFLMRLKNALFAILLPLPKEGFYLPGLEAMALGTPVIMPDCFGNRAYATHDQNCLLISREAIFAAVCQLDLIKLEQLREEGIKTAARFTLENERQQFFKILRNIKALLIQHGGKMPDLHAR